MTHPLRPLMLGIAGDSGSGKTTLTRGLVCLLCEQATTVIRLDDYHKYDRQERTRHGLPALNPACNYMEIMAQHMHMLRLGQPILKPVYNHSNGCLERPEFVQPTPVVIVEGLLTLSTPALQRSFDITVYLDPDERLRRRWKILRDTTTRGYTQEQVLDLLARRLPDSEQYIWSQRKAADLVVRYWPPYGYFDESVDHARLNVRRFQRHSLPRPNLQALLAQAQSGDKPALKLESDVWSGGQPADILDIDGAISAEKAGELTAILWQHLRFSGNLSPDCLGNFREGVTPRHSEPLALTQLLIAYYLLTIRQHYPEDGRTYAIDDQSQPEE